MQNNKHRKADQVRDDYAEETKKLQVLEYNCIDITEIVMLQHKVCYIINSFTYEQQEDRRP